MYNEEKIWIGRSGEEKVFIYPSMANRHGMIAGATGTGKTVTLKVLAESFSDCGVPVFLADVKGDLAGMCRPGVETEDMNKRIERFALNDEGFAFKSYPTEFWDVYAQKGLPLRTTVTEMGPLLLGRILGLNETQTDILTVIFRIADDMLAEDKNMLLIDTKDLRSMISYVTENCKELSVKYGNIPTQSLGVIMRSVMALEAEGADRFFGEPALDIRDWITRSPEGRGTIQVLDCQTLINNPNMYSTFLLWMLSELFETLPEAGDLDRPKMVFFFDEAHLLFDSAPKALLDKVEQVVKLIRSKGVGVFFITQNPRDIPDAVLAQLGTKIQHALHAYTPGEQKACRAAAQSFRENPEFDTYEVLTSLGIGEALVSVLDEQGIPTIVKQTKILPPQSRMGAIDDEDRAGEISRSFLHLKYDESVDRDSAYEFLIRLKAKEDEEVRNALLEKQREKEEAEAEKLRLKEEEAARKQAEREEAAAKKQAEKEEAAARREAEREAARAEAAKKKEEEAAKKKAEREEAAKKNAVKNAVKGVASSTAGTVGREVGNALGKTMGGSFGKKVGGNVGASLGRGIIGTLFKLK
ncbi:MAG: DUF853 domain-containing protein [Lachnospiraceae bacterium]|nr:DUF853 domain-containing protein [Lachnospiraceae bacterium]